MNNLSENSSRIAQLEQELGKLELTHPELADLPQLLEMYEQAGSDTRSIDIVSESSYPSMGEAEAKRRWEEALSEADGWLDVGMLAESDFLKIKVQSEAILSSQPIPQEGEMISDPFNMAIVERIGIKQLQRQQLKNIVVIKRKGEVIATGRVLNVEGSWEIASIVSKEKYRKKGLASIIIQEILSNFLQRPLYSFQRLHLVSYYMREYARGNPQIATFSDLPPAMQRDLFRMNIFWGPFVIIKVPD